MDAHATIHELTAAFAKGAALPLAVTEDYLARIGALDAKVGAYLTVTRDEALAAARASEARYRAGAPLSPLDGVPLAIKDVLLHARHADDLRLEDPRDVRAAVRRHRRRAAARGRRGAPRQDEHGRVRHGLVDRELRPSTSTRNPVGPRRACRAARRAASAAAVAAGLAARRLRHRHGRLDAPAGRLLRRRRAQADLRPRVALRADRLRVLARSGRAVRATTSVDAALLLGAVAGHDPLDATSIDAPVPDYTAALGARRRRACASACPTSTSSRASTPRSSGRCAPRSTCSESLRRARSSTCRCRTPTHGVATYYIVAPAEASSNLARYDGVKYGLRVPAQGPDRHVSRTRAAGFGAEVKRRIMLGTYALSAGYYDAYYGQAQKVRTLIRRDFEQAFERVDVIAAPTTPGVRLQASARRTIPLAMYLNDVFTIPAQPGGPARGLGAVRLQRRRAADRAAAHRHAASTRRRCCARPTPTSRRPPGARGAEPELGPPPSPA